MVYWLEHLTLMQARPVQIKSETNYSWKKLWIVNRTMIVLRGQPAGSCAWMALNYSRCIVLGSGPV